MSRRSLTLVICAVALLPVSLASQAVGGAGVQMDGPALTTQKIRPGDGSERDPAFARVRQALLSAAGRNDLDAVVRYFAPQIFCYTEGMITAAACAAHLRADPSLNFLPTLQHALEIGTAFDEDTIVAPYVAHAAGIVYALPDIPGGSYLVVTADRVRARSAPSSGAPVVEMLSYDIVATMTFDPDSTRTTPTDACDAWAHILTPTKREAWICWKYLSVPSEEPIFIFQRQVSGDWRLASMYVQTA